MNAECPENEKDLISVKVSGAEIKKPELKNTSDLIKNITVKINTTIEAETLCMNIDGGDFIKCENHPNLIEVFNEVEAEQVKSGTWLERNPIARKKVLESHMFYQKDEILLGGFSHEKLNKNLILIQCVWSQEKYNGNGISKVMLENYLQQNPEDALVLYCNQENTKALASFEKIGFMTLETSHPAYSEVNALPHGDLSISMILEPKKN